ncbi:PREDICTED: uncharacterized protein LOC106743169, partial [Dinoponera quadriceps]|uniref:Uncharacterized protein LOC106743169 n=1 Tax=Dinoponera quadriceps TaxID=609295 RepID=A0A6P3X1Q4_DINQU
YTRSEILIKKSKAHFFVLEIRQNTDISNVLKYVCFICGQQFYLFFISFEGQRLADHSFQMRDKIYSSYWYEAPKKSQKLMIMVMTRSLQPLVLRAGKIYIFCLENFVMVKSPETFRECYLRAVLMTHNSSVSKVLQTSMSYFTMLMSMQ